MKKGDFLPTLLGFGFDSGHDSIGQTLRRGAFYHCNRTIGPSTVGVNDLTVLILEKCKTIHA